MRLGAVDTRGLDAAVEQARLGLAEGGIPIGAAAVLDGEVIGVGGNRRLQNGSAILHAETDALERAGILSAEEYARATLRSAAGRATGYGQGRCRPRRGMSR